MGKARQIATGKSRGPDLAIWHSGLSSAAAIRYSSRRQFMNKKTLIKKILDQLTSELEIYFKAAASARADATHEQSKAEGKYDTRGLEASYLARGQSRQALEVQESIAAFEKLVPRKFRSGEPIDLGALVELQQGKETLLYFVGPRAGGTEVIHDQREVLVITPQSPLGEQLMGRREGDLLKLALPGADRQQRVLTVT
jgi:transcription elongation GreA/GreB family factor